MIAWRGTADAEQRRSGVEASVASAPPEILLGLFRLGRAAEAIALMALCHAHGSAS